VSALVQRTMAMQQQTPHEESSVRSGARDKEL
jgi:hypothetical protein